MAPRLGQFGKCRITAASRFRTYSIVRNVQTNHGGSFIVAQVIVGKYETECVTILNPV